MVLHTLTGLPGDTAFREALRMAANWTEGGPDPRVECNLDHSEKAGYWSR